MGTADEEDAMTTLSEFTARPVVVGVDGSESALAATRWAAAEARRRKVPLRVVLVFDHPMGYAVGDPRLGPELHERLLSSTRRSLAEAVAVAERAAPGHEVSGEVVVGFPVTVLAEQSGTAQLVVVGSRGLGGLAGLLLGSVAVGLAAGASCPVVVVRADEPDPHGPVVVGVDGTPCSEAAVAFAFDTAARRGAELVAVHVWVTHELVPGSVSPAQWAATVEEEKRVLAERLAGWGAKYPDVPVRRVVLRDGAASALVQLSEGAQLVVVGSHGRRELAGLLLGSVSHAVLHRSHCPVAVVRPDLATAGDVGR